MIANFITADLKTKLIVGGAVATGLYLLLNKNKSQKPKTNGLNGTGKRKKSVSGNKGRKTATFKF